MSINVQLPDEITTEILSRLPVDSVIECKRVCRTWKSLIDDPTFADTHTRNHLLRVDHSNSNSDDDVFFLLSELLQPGFPTRRFVEFHFGKYMMNADDEDQMGGLKISKALSNINEDLVRWEMVGSSNGLICLSSSRSIYVVYNPCTREYVNLGHLRFKTMVDDYKYGFGYHPYTNEYKVVVCHNYGKDKKQLREVRVYALGSGTWRSRGEEEELSHTHHYLCGYISAPGVLMNGALYWLRTNGNRYVIVSFDLADEKFRSNSIMPSVPAAVTWVPDIMAWTDLGLLEGCLCIAHHNLVSKSSDIWVMNNRDKFWTMKFKITQKKDVEEYYRPIARLGSKVLLLCKKSGTIASYNIETGNIDYEIVRDGYPNHDFVYNMVEAIPYVKSFVSLKALGEEGAKNAK